MASWPATYRQVTALASTPAVRRRYPDAAAKFDAETKQVQADTPLAEQAAKMLGLYMHALGDLAGGTVTDISKQASSIQSSIKTLGSASPDVQLATDALGLLLNTWQNYAITEIVAKSNSPVQIICMYLANVSDAVGNANRSAARATDEYWTAIGMDSKNQFLQVLAQRAIDQDEAAYGLNITKAQAARSAFQKIGQDHAALAASGNNLESAKATLVADLPLLEDAAKILLK